MIEDNGDRGERETEKQIARKRKTDDHRREVKVTEDNGDGERETDDHTREEEER